MLVADAGNGGRLWCRSGAADEICPKIECELDVERSRWRWVGVPFFTIRQKLRLTYRKERVNRYS